MGVPGGDRTPVTLAELIATLSLAADLGLGQPMEHVARSCLIAVRLAQRLGLDREDIEASYYLALLAWVGCTADSHETATLFGDDLELRAGIYDVEIGSPAMLGYLLLRAGSDRGALHRVRVATELVATGGRNVRQSLATHCQVTGRLAVRLGLNERIAAGLTQTFARWDGRGSPDSLRGADIDIAIRLVQLADIVEVHHRRGGVAGALAAARSRSGTTLDPALVAEFATSGPDLLENLPADSSWEDLIAANPTPRALTEVEEAERAYRTRSGTSRGR